LKKDEPLRVALCAGLVQSCCESAFAFPEQFNRDLMARPGDTYRARCFSGGRRRHQAVSLCDGDHTLSRIGQPHKHMAISMVPATDPLI